LIYLWIHIIFNNSMPDKKSIEVTQFFIFVAVITLLLLSALNIENYLAPKEVLGIEAQEPNNDEFWTKFLEENPDYIPGWVELGRWDKVKQVDPNWFPQP